MSNPAAKIRLYVAQAFLPGAHISLGEKQSHYLHHVMRLREGDGVLVFNGQQGEWLATVSHVGKRALTLMVGQQHAAFQPSTDMWLAFALIKNKSELVVEKASELGVSRILPFVAQHGVVKNINLEKLEAHAVEASEQCERHDVATFAPYKNLGALLGEFPADRLLLYGDETGGGEPLASIFRSFPPPLRGGGQEGGESNNANLTTITPAPTLPPQGGGRFCILIGPEGGFSAYEHEMLRAMENAQSFGMGPRIMRADTAAVAALACAQMHCGDWHLKPHFKETK